jgi:hypothetical protein
VKKRFPGVILSGFALYDMLGDVSQWVSDWYDENYYQGSPSQDPTGPASGQARVVRGGSWATLPGTSASRTAAGTAQASDTTTTGFVARGKWIFPESLFFSLCGFFGGPGLCPPPGEAGVIGTRKAREKAALPAAAGLGVRPLALHHPGAGLDATLRCLHHQNEEKAPWLGAMLLARQR